MPEERSIAALVITDLPVALARHRHPELHGRPLAVIRERTVVAASREARAEGVCPGASVEQTRGRAVAVPFDASQVERARARTAERLNRYSPRVEADGAGRWYLDLSGTGRYFRRGPVDLASEAAAELDAELGAAVRAGLAGGKAVARMAAGTEGRVARVRYGQEPAFLSDLPATALPGLAARDRERLQRLGLQRVGDVVAAPCARLERVFGPAARLWQQWGRGWDPRPVGASESPTRFRETLPIADQQSLAELAPALFGAAERLGRRLRDRRERAERLRAALEFRDGAERARLAHVAPTDHDLALYEAFHGLAAAAWNRRVTLRRLMLDVVARSGDGQGELFAGSEDQDRLLRGIDAVRDRFGPDAVRWGRQLRGD
jgi:DNA polymerase-4